MLQEICNEWKNYCIEALKLKQDDFSAFRIFKTANGEPFVFLFQVGCTKDYYLCIANVDNPQFERLETHKSTDGTHHQTRIKELKRILGEEILFKLIKEGLFFNDTKKKRHNDESILAFIRSTNGNDNSSVQVHRLACLLAFPRIDLNGKEVHHIDLCGANNKGANIVPITPELHTGKNSIHFNYGSYRPDADALSLGLEYQTEFIKRYEDLDAPKK